MKYGYDIEPVQSSAQSQIVKKKNKDKHTNSAGLKTNEIFLFVHISYHIFLQVCGPGWRRLIHVVTDPLPSITT